jgi:hypothetical protein
VEYKYFILVYGDDMSLQLRLLRLSHPSLLSKTPIMDDPLGFDFSMVLPPRPLSYSSIT